jgi:succinate dehydrogenase / fumarate reductase flavoprotein subunit
MGLPFNRTLEGRSTSAASAATPVSYRRSAGSSILYAADRTGHMISQTLFQNCVKLGINFFNEFYVLDLVMTEVTDAFGVQEQLLWRRRLRTRRHG